MSRQKRTVLCGGMVIDGTGAPARPADVAVVGDRIADVGDIAAGGDDAVLDVTGLTVAPGFHDIHTHYDLELLARPAHLDGLRQGVTTYQIAECGLGFAPASAATHAEFRTYLACLAGTDDVPPWTTIAEYQALYERNAVVNCVSMVPHGIVRAEVMGMTAGAASPAQLDAMKHLVREAMEQGARGLTTGLTYFPSCEADTDELVALAQVVAEYGGVYVTHLRSYSNTMLEAIDEAGEIGRRAGVPVQISHLRPRGPLVGRGAEVLARIDAIRQGGVDMAFDNYTYLKGCTLMAAFVLPPDAYAGGVTVALDTLRDPARRDDLRARMPNEDWTQVHIANVPSAKNRHVAGMTLAAFAESRGTDVFEACVELLIDEELCVSAVGGVIDEDDLRRNFKHPCSYIGSDSIPAGGHRHPRACGCFARYLGHYVREERLLPLEEAVRRITSAAARRFGLTDRGVLAAGMAADITVFDPATIADRATYEQPLTPSEGVHHVLVNGQLVLRDGRLTDARPGCVLG